MGTDGPTPDTPTLDDLGREILRQVAARGAGGSICPSEVARVHGEHWRTLMPRVRQAACALSRAGLIDVLRKGRPVDPDGVRGVIRLRLRPPVPGQGPSDAGISGA